jgi:hypothetical protein
MTHQPTPRVLVAALSLFAVACGGPIDQAPVPSEKARCLKFSLPDDGLVTAPPARVSLFFTVDTCGGEPVAGLPADQFVLKEDGRNVSTFESQLRISPRGEKFRMYSMLLLDLSGSILRSGQFPALVEAANHYVDTVLQGGRNDGQKVAIYGFDGRAAPFSIVEFTSEPAELKAGLEKLSARECNVSADCARFSDRRVCAGWLCVDDSTNLNGAVVTGLERLDRELQAEPSIRFKEGALLVFTDGTDQASRVSKETAEGVASKAKSRTFTVGLGGEVDEQSLRAIGRDGFQLAGETGQLSAAFAEVAKRVRALASRFYLLEYCSPKRGGKHQLEIGATVTDAYGVTLSGSVARPFDATGFESGCDLGPSN